MKFTKTVADALANKVLQQLQEARKKFLDEFCKRIGFDCNNISPRSGALTKQNANDD